MSAQTIIDKANGIIADANALATGGAWPAAVNCLGGTVPTATAFTSTDFWNSMCTYYGRQQGQLRNGWVPWLGTSIGQGQDVAQIHPACVNMGIGGDTLRGVLNRMAGITALSRAGAVIFEYGTNDAGYDTYENISLMLDRVYGWLTGPLVVISLIPQPGCSVATCDAVNGLMQTKLSGRPKCVYVDITTPLRDTDGWMKSSLSIGDRMHPNASGYALIRPSIAQALQTVTA
ncbi:MAG TPA: SGNH/GDSL hydrolase family protein [Kofleriaceae bacterium]